MAADVGERRQREIVCDGRRMTLAEFEKHVWQEDREGDSGRPDSRGKALLEWANRCLREDVPLDVLAAALPYSGAGDDEAMTVIDRLADAGWLIVPTPEVVPSGGHNDGGES